MEAKELALKYPVLYHLTVPRAVPGILRHGLLATSQLLDLFEVPAAERELLERQRRQASVPISHPVHGEALLTDNLPLTERALQSCLDDGLAPSDWLLMLNARVFFWPDLDNLTNHANARMNRNRELTVIEFDTLRLAESYLDRIELSPINSGSTIRKPARRGLSTFAPAARFTYAQWRALRRKHDTVKEVAVLGGLPDAARFILRHYSAAAHQPRAT